MNKKQIASVMASAALCSCTSELSPNDIAGQWTQVEISSRIGDSKPEISNEPTTWTLNADNTYTIDDEENCENGRWLLTADSLLVLLTEGVDSLRTTYKILSCNDDTLIQQSVTESEYGLITETTTLIRKP